MTQMLALPTDDGVRWGNTSRVVPQVPHVEVDGTISNVLKAEQRVLLEIRVSEGNRIRAISKNHPGMWVAVKLALRRFADDHQ